METCKANILDDDFISSLRAGNMHSYKILFELYYPKVRSYMDSFALDADTVKDIAQNVFMKVWLNRNSLKSRSGGNLEGYIFTIAKNEVLNWFRSRKTLSCLDDGIALSLTEDMRYPEVIDAKVSLKAIDMIVSQMPEIRKKVFVMSRVRNMSNEDISESLNISKRTVEKHISLAIKQIKKKLPSLYTILAFL